MILTNDQNFKFSDLWEREIEIFDQFQEQINVGYSFQSIYSVLSKICLKNIGKEFYENFVNNLILYAYYEEGDHFSYTSIALGALLLFFECYYLNENFKHLKMFVKENKKNLGENFSSDIV